MLKKIFLNYYFLILVYRIILDITYINTTILYTYMGFAYNPRDILVIIFSYIIMILLMYIQTKDHKPSSIVLFIIFLLNVVPAFTLFSYNSEFGFQALMYLILSYGLTVIVMKSVSSIKLKMNKKHINNKIFISILAFFYLIFLGLMLKHFGIKFSLPSLDNVYDVRTEFKENISRSIGYIFNWFGSILNPFIFLLALKQKNKIVLSISIFSQLYLFSVGGHKTMLFTLFVVYMLYFFLVYFNKFQLQKLLLVIIIFMLSSFVLYDSLVEEYSLITAVIAMRVFLIPAQMYFLYFDFFQINPYDFFGQNFPFSLFIESHYARPIPSMIGGEYFNRPDVFANANIFADAYANLGYGGILFVIIVFVPVFYAFDRMAKSKDRTLILPIIVLLSFTMVNASLVTSLVTFGILFFMIIVNFLPNYNNNIKKSESRKRKYN